VAIYRAAQALVGGDAQATVANARRGMDLLAEDDHLGRGAAAALIGLASWGSGDLAVAHSAYADCIANMERAGHIADVLACTITLADIEIVQGRLGDAMLTYERALALAPPRDDGFVLRGTADMYVGIAALHRERDDLAAATRLLRRSQELGDHIGLPQNPYRWRVAMARVREAEGDLAGAVELLDDAERVYVGDFSPNVRPIPAMRARVWIAQGKLEDALDWARERHVSIDDELSYLREYEHVTLARLLLAQYRNDRSERLGQQVVALLQRLLAAAEEAGRTGTALEILILQALAFQVRGDTAAALVPVQRALPPAEREGYARILLDEGEPMAALLGAVAQRGTGSGYVRRLLAAFDGGGGTEARPATPPGLVEPLSERERDVLRLLATDLGGPDIARELVVSLNTVRTHTKNVYAKLGVNNRRAAVRKAGELGLLPRTGRTRA
jgi:LuxR family maltose regulon positive regulatory protein